MPPKHRRMQAEEVTPAAPRRPVRRSQRQQALSASRSAAARARWGARNLASLLGAAADRADSDVDDDSGAPAATPAVQRRSSRCAAAAAAATQRAAFGRPEPELGVYNTHLKGSKEARVKDLLLSLTFVKTGGDIDIRVVEATQAWCQE